MPHLKKTMSRPFKEQIEDVVYFSCNLLIMPQLQIIYACEIIFSLTQDNKKIQNNDFIYRGIYHYTSYSKLLIELCFNIW